MNRHAYIAIAFFFALSVVTGTDITGLIPAMKKMYFINISAGVIFLTYALVRSYRQQVC
jgi:hypothetical protein